MSDYTPIDCDLYSEYELAIMHRCKLRIGWRDTAGLTHIETLMPRDLQTRQGEEFLIAETAAAERIEIRLDQITEAKPLTPE